MCISDRTKKVHPTISISNTILFSDSPKTWSFVQLNEQASASGRVRSSPPSLTCTFAEWCIGRAQTAARSSKRLRCRVTAALASCRSNDDRNQQATHDTPFVAGCRIKTASVLVLNLESLTSYVDPIESPCRSFADLALCL